MNYLAYRPIVSFVKCGLLNIDRKDLGEQEVTKFLIHLAVNRKVTSSTQNLALCAIVFMYKRIFERQLTLLPDAASARAPNRVPTVLSHKETLLIIGLMKPKYKLMFSLLYGSGLRKAELLKLRIKDIDFDAETVFVFRGKGGKDRTTMLSKKLIEPTKGPDRNNSLNIPEGYC